MRWTVFTVAFCVVLGGQTPSPLPAFEAAPVKVTQRGMSGLHGGPGTPNPGQIVGQSVSLLSLAMETWSIKPYQISGLTGSEPEVYDVVAKVPVGTTREDSRVMLQRLLAERFGLVVHQECQRCRFTN